MKNKILVIIPAYNEEESIEKVVSNLENDFSFYDYVVINDGSKDATSEICHKNGFNIIDLPENLGLTGAVQTGFKYALKNGGAPILIGSALLRYSLQNFFCRYRFDSL